MNDEFKKARACLREILELDLCEMPETKRNCKFVRGVLRQAEEEKKELTELKEFVKIISSHTNINRLTLIGENEITISYFSEKWHKNQFDLVKKVVEKYGN